HFYFPSNDYRGQLPRELAARVPPAVVFTQGQGVPKACLVLSVQIRRRFCGRQPLCGTGVTSEIDAMRMPSAASARTEDSRPGPGPRISTSRFLMPWSMAARPATSDATWAANGVDLREPLKPWPPEDAQDSALPWRSVIVMIVLLKEACTCATPSDTFLRTFLRTRCAALLAGALAMSYLFPCLM